MKAVMKMNYKLIDATDQDVDLLIKYKLATILDYANGLSEEENKKNKGIC